LERLSLEEQVRQVQAEFDKYRQERELEDMMVVKLEVPTIDPALLTQKETKIEDLEIEKAKLEAKVHQLSSEYNLVLSDKDSLAEKIRLFQTKCATLETQMRVKEEESSELIRQLRREGQLLRDKNDSSVKAIRDLTAQIEELLASKASETSKLEAKFDKERARADGLEKQFKRTIKEKTLLEERLKTFSDTLEGIEAKMTAKVTEIGNLNQQNGKLQKQVEELRAMILKMKKQEQAEQAELDAKFKDRDAEIEVLKEMIKGVKIQLKCKCFEYL